jgi:alanyl-tRNA synthetase
MTDKLYENDSMQQSCQSVVMACRQKDDHFEVLLDRTVIFPEGGGQLSDQGWLNKEPVFYASEDGPDVWHWTKKAFREGEPVTVTLNWDVRLDRMQQHCGEHMLSFAFWKTCGANNVGFHMNEESVFIDLDKEVTEEDVKKAELLANKAIWENNPITLHYVPHTELGNYQLRKKNEKLRGTVRLVAIKNGDTCTCCGTHPPFTGMVGSVKVIRFSHYKGGCRIEFLCGRRALEEMHKRNLILEETSNLLSVKAQEVLPAVEKLRQDSLNLRSQLREKTQALFKHELPQILKEAPLLSDGTRFVWIETEGIPADGKSIMKLVSALDHVLAAVILKNDNRVMYQFAVTGNGSFNCRDFCQMANEVFEGRGGGSPKSAQGGGTAGLDWKQKAESLRSRILKENQ